MSIFKHIGIHTTAMAIFAVGCCAVLLGSCSRETDNRYAKMDVAADSMNIAPYSIVRFDKEVMTIDQNNVDNGLNKLLEKYGDLFDYYCQKCAEVGPAYTDGNKSTFNANTAKVVKNEVLSNPAYQFFYQAEDSVYANGLEKEMGDLTDGMRRFHYFFPEAPLPQKVLTMFSCFGPKITVGYNMELMVSLEYYLGSTYKHYKSVPGIYDYELINLDRDKMVRDMMLFWAYGCYPMPKDADRLLDQMLYQGKMMYILEACLPKMDKTQLMGYTKDQWQWSEENEKNMWDKVKESKHLYTFDRLTISKYINPAPHTVFFPYDATKDFTPEAPGKGGIWLGWRIVSSYMKNNEKATLADLMAMTDSQKLLEDSGYNPR